MRLSLSGGTSLTGRLTVLFAAASTAVLLLLGYLVATSVEQHFEQQDLAILNGKLELVAHALEKVRSQDELSRLPAQLSDSLVGHHSLDIMVTAPDGTVLFLTKGANFPENVLRGAASKVAGSTVWRKSPHYSVRGIAKLAATGIPGAPAATIAVATDVGHHEHFMEGFQRTLWSVVALGAVLTGLLGWGAARRGLAPLRAMGREAGAITARRLDARLSADAVPAELAELADTLNGMLSRLEDSFRRLSNFSSDLAHELRTPVSNLLTQTQVTLSKSRTVEQYRDILASNAEEFERLSRIVSDMLFLAKSENDLVVPNREPVSLADEVSSVLEFYEALAEEKGIAVALVGQGSISGDRLMIRRAINNLVSNAVRHTPPGGTITVRITQRGEAGAELQVENAGEGVAAEHLPRLFDRFYRVDFARKRQSDGAGLGLAITRSIVRAHGGDVAAHSQGGLTTFCLTFPA
ncbi:two-component sensor histidine kinase [Massilia eurypsychrophila]|uniref:Sensor protein n=1 Tax=Massilia eurypsychrophila TaxID=1485217 RepID=A0A2G8T7N3_9BURK|nr:heavy metal sensor histidine kinase [Massilia eurypsychrophila]PIL42065.1 two-component sensor histidine kinase [Massilia eurypsychrophila]